MPKDAEEEWPEEWEEPQESALPREQAEGQMWPGDRARKGL